MTRLRSATLALGAALAAGAASSFMVAGCGDDTTGQGSDSGGGDSTTDGEPDSQPETGPTESGPDTNTADADGGVIVEAGEASTPDAEAGVAPILAFARQEALAWCQQFLGCCPGGAGGYDLNGCAQTLVNYGWENSLAPNSNSYNTGRMTFDPDAGAACLAAIKSMPCAPQQPAQWAPITQECFKVMAGAADAGSQCYSSWECSPGMYCDNLDGGVSNAPNAPLGTCLPLKTQGQPCNSDQMCSYLGSSQPASYCDLIDFPDAGSATCQALLATGANCISSDGTVIDDMACQALLCGDNGTCGTQLLAPYPVFCNAWAITDAGGGG